MALGDAGDNSLEELEGLQRDTARMLRQAVSLGFLGFVVMMVSTTLLYPEAIGMVFGIATLCSSMGFAMGRWVFRQERSTEQASARSIMRSTQRMEELVERFINKEMEMTRIEIDRLSLRLSQEKAARRAAQRELVQHLQDCDV